MFGSLRNHSDDSLMEYVRLILSRPGDLDEFSLGELEEIDDEIQRRILERGYDA